MKYFPARPLSAEEEQLVERGYRALLAGELKRYAVTYRQGTGESSVGIDVRNEAEAWEVAHRLFGGRLQAHGGKLTVELQDHPSGYYDTFRPWGVGPAIDLVPRGHHSPGCHQWLERHRGFQQMELPL